MSHVDSGFGIITDLDCLRAVVARDLKLEWCEGKTTYEWYGQWMQDYSDDRAAFNRGINTEQYGKCDHAIRLKGCKYEIGVTKREDGTGWSLVWDKYASGIKISEHIGADAQHLMSAYNLEYIQRMAAETGCMMQQTELENGDLAVELIET